MELSGLSELLEGIGRMVSSNELLRRIAAELRHQRKEKVQRSVRPDPAKRPEFALLQSRIARLKAAGQGGRRLKSLQFADFLFLSPAGLEKYFRPEAKEEDRAAALWFCEPEGELSPGPHRSLLVNRRSLVGIMCCLFIISITAALMAALTVVLMPPNVAEAPIVALCATICLASMLSTFILARVRRTFFQLELKNQLERARTAIYPWQSARWLALAYRSLTEYSPLFIQKIYIFDGSKGGEAPNHVNFFLRRVVEAAGYVLDGFAASMPRGGADSFVGEGRFDGAIKEVEGHLPALEARWLGFPRRVNAILQIMAVMALLWGIGSFATLCGLVVP